MHYSCGLRREDMSAGESARRLRWFQSQLLSAPCRTELAVRWVLPFLGSAWRDLTTFNESQRRLNSTAWTCCKRRTPGLASKSLCGICWEKCAESRSGSSWDTGQLTASFRMRRSCSEILPPKPINLRWRRERKTFARSSLDGDRSVEGICRPILNIFARRAKV